MKTMFRSSLRAALFLCIFSFLILPGAMILQAGQLPGLYGVVGGALAWSVVDAFLPSMITWRDMFRTVVGGLSHPAYMLSMIFKRFRGTMGRANRLRSIDGAGQLRTSQTRRTLTVYTGSNRHIHFA